MANSGIELTLLVPGLLGPVTGVPRQYLAAEQDWPGLASLLEHSKDSAWPQEVPELALAELFGWAEAASAPLAALSYRGDFGKPPAGAVLRADLVHLQAGAQDVLQYDANRLAITLSEAEALLSALNALVRGDGLWFEMATPQRWYLRLSTCAVHTTPLSQSLGRALAPLMPRGEQGSWLRTLLTELQMLLHQHPVNQHREAQGSQTINGIWLWGEGEDREAAPSMHWTGAYGDEALLRGLVQAAQGRLLPLPAQADELMRLEGRWLLLLMDAWYPARYGDLQAWQQVLTQWDAHWFLPLAEALQVGRLSQLTLLPLRGLRHVYTRRRWYDWRRGTGSLIERLG